MKLTILGTGYVGLVAGAGFSDFGNDVVCVDVDAERIQRLCRGEVPIHEPGLAALIKRNLDKRLTFTTDTRAAVAQAEVIFLAVGTPSGPDGAADLSYVDTAAAEIGAALTQWAVIVTKSTVPVGTAQRVHSIVAKHTDMPFAVASNPEFLKEGDAVNDFMKPARIILGVDDQRAAQVLRNLYAPFVRTNDRVQIMDVRSAELAKYAANAMLATRISFMNELALLCEAVGADIERVRRAVGSDPRIGPKFLFSGPGFGGSCFPKDLRALIHTAQGADVPLEVVAAASKANDRQKQVLPARVRARFGDDLSEKRVAVWGLSFKPETDDIRESPALDLIDSLLSARAEVVVFDPAATENGQRHYGDQVRFSSDMYAAAEGADALVLVTEWHQFRRPDFGRLREVMRGRDVFDGRNIWNPVELAQLEFRYQGIGRAPTVGESTSSSSA